MITLFLYLKKIYEGIIYSKTGFNKDAFAFIHSNNFENLIDSDDLCIEFMNLIMEDKMFLVSINKYRANHIIATWLLGVGFAKVFHFYEKSSDFLHLHFYQIWLQTSITHDYGYLRNEIKERKTIEQLSKPYNLLTDDYNEPIFASLRLLSTNFETKNCFTYTYEEIKNYYKLRLESLKEEKNENECCDHGILGGCIAFSNYCAKAIKNFDKFEIEPGISIPRIQKIACFNTASHNIYKSPNKKTDNKYLKMGLKNLLSTSKKRVTRNNILLLLLSLVDTVECLKRFSAFENKNEYLRQSTILKKIEITELNSSVKIDFSHLREYITKVRKSDEMLRKLTAHENDVNPITCTYLIKYLR